MTARASWASVASLVLSLVPLGALAAEPAAAAPAESQATDEADADEADAEKKESPRQEVAPPVDPGPLFRSRWKTSFYGFVEVDAMSDSTQSFAEVSLNNSVAQRGTYAGDNGQSQATAKNSRLGFRIDPPDFGWISSYAQIEFDFFGMAPIDATQNDYAINGPMRLRQAFLALKTPVIDVIAGQHPNLFGWNGAGFFPSTVAFLGLPGQVYHRDTQLRLSHTFGREAAASFEIAGAAVRPGQRQSRLPDLEAGLRFAINRWRGPSTQGNSQPALVPLSLGVSGMYRFFAVAEYLELPRRALNKNGWGAAVNAVIPVIPAKDINDRGNSITLTGEFSIGSGIADRYSSLTGGARFQALPNPRGLARAPIYRPNVDPGLITFDFDNRLKTFNWRAFVVGAQYYLPAFSGRVWVTGTYSRLESDNIAELTPVPNHGNVFTKLQYFDGNLFLEITPSIQLGLSFQVTQTTWADGANPQNMRGHGALNFFF